MSTIKTKTNTRKRKNPKLMSFAWAWKIKTSRNKWGLCHWADPDKETLIEGGIPSSEAKAVRVKLVAY